METGKIVYITLGEKTLAHLAHHHIKADPAIPVPVEIPAGAEKADPDAASDEMLLSGMLNELASGCDHAEYYRKLVWALRPNLLNELTGAAILKAKNGEKETALEIFRLLEGAFPNNKSILLNRALIAETEEAWEEALAAPLPDTLFNGGYFYYNRGDYKRAAELFAQYLENEEEAGGDSGAEGGDADNGFANNAEEKREKARELAAEIKKNGLDDESFRNAYTLIRNGEEEKGILEAKAFLERAPTSGKGWFVLGWGLRRLERWEDGAACFAKAIELGVANADVRNEYAICLMESGDYGKAKKQLEAALKEEIDNVKIISNLGVLALKQGLDDEAAAFFRAVLELDAADPVANAYFKN